jgi:hypothetical protein
VTFDVALDEQRAPLVAGGDVGDGDAAVDALPVEIRGSPPASR